MTRIKTKIIFLFVAFAINSYGQNLVDSNTSVNNENTSERKVIAEYSGGRFGFSSISLTLFSDSTYIYYSWLHTGDKYHDKGIFSRSQSKIMLHSDTLITLNNFFGQRTFIAFDNQKFRLQGDKILLYSKRQEIFDRSDFYEAYFTLYLNDLKKKE